MAKTLSFIKNNWRVIGLSVSFAPFITVGLFALVITSHLAPLLQAKLLGDIVNGIIDTLDHSESTRAVAIFVAMYAGVWGGTRIINATQLFLDKIWYLINEHEFEILFMKKRAEIDLGHYENSDFQNLLTRGTRRGIWPLVEMSDAQFQIWANIILILVSSVITSAISWKIYLITVITAIPSFVVQFKYGYKIWSIWGEHSERQRKYSSLRSHLWGRKGVMQVKILQNGDYLLGIIRGILDSFRKDNRFADKKRFYSQIIASIIASAGLAFSLWLIAQDVIAGLINVGAMVFVIGALGQLVGALNSLLAQIATQLEKNLYVTDLFEILDTRPFIKRSENPIKLDLKEPPLIEFRNVSFKYEGRDEWILRNVSLEFKPGEKIALVGMNGAGKSTLIKLLSRIYDPNEGDIYVNNTNLKDVDPDEWNKYLSVLLQDYLTYDLTVAESIAISKSDTPIDSARVEESGKNSGSHEFIVEWENKYDQQLGKEFVGGVEPSKGQQQKLALARTIYKNALVMVLDEPTASIDALSETQIFEAMENAAGKNTLIVITHRFNTTQNLDKIIVIERGEIIETGTHRELMKKAGRYKEMFDSQAKAFREELLDERTTIS